MENQLRFDGRVVIVTGAGAGLGRAYALLFGSRGASVVVNDLGGSRAGDGKSTKAADTVTDEIKKLGGTAVADYNSVVEGEKIVKTALDNFGRIDIVVNNAGILRDKSFARISNDDWDLVHNVHLKGAFKTSQAAWPIFRKQKYGKIIVTSSNSGLYGNFGQANYSAAKMGLVGLCNTLAIEGRSNNICCNVIVPTAASRLTEDILPPELFAELKPELIAPVVVWLCHESCTENGAVIEAAGGWATKYGLIRGIGATLRKKITDSVTPEDVKRNWSQVVDLEVTEQLSSIQESTGTLMDQLENMRSDHSNNSQEETHVHPITFKDILLYALSIGASTKNQSDMKYLYENDENFSPFPTMAIIPALMAVTTSNHILSGIPGQSLDLSKILHGEQYLEVYHPLPTNGDLRNVVNILEILDKGRNAIIIAEVNTFNEFGIKIAYNQISIFVLGAGGFGGVRNSNKAIQPVNVPNRQPDASVKQTTSHDQAALYRLTGDLNPLHIDNDFAEIAGYKRPILHGMCSLGFAARHVLATFGNNDPSNFKAIKARLSKPVFPGETLKTDMWQERNRIHFRTIALESGNEVITGAYMDLHNIKSEEYMFEVSVSRELASDVLFNTMLSKIKAAPELCKKVNGVFLYNITEGPGNIIKKWTCDLKNGDVYEGEPKDGVKVDTYLTIDDKDFVEIALGKLNPQKAFMSGKLKIRGNIMLPQKLGNLLSAEAKL